VLVAVNGQKVNDSKIYDRIRQVSGNYSSWDLLQLAFKWDPNEMIGLGAKKQVQRDLRCDLSRFNFNSAHG